MPTKKPEMDLRQRLADGMKGLWLLTWHEDGLVNPGVPDVSFVFRGNFETGWLELKAERYSGETVKFEIRADQISWIRNHRNYIPIRILAQWGEDYYLFDASCVEALNNRLTRAEIDRMAASHSKADGLRKMLTKELQKATDRFRNVE
jgi:hypothetical protein